MPTENEGGDVSAAPEGKVLPPPPSAAPASKATRVGAPLTSKFALNTLILLAVSILGQFTGWIATKLFFVELVQPGVAQSLGLQLMGFATLYMLISSTIYTLGDLRFVTAYQFFVARGGNVGSLTGAYLLFRFVSLGIAAGGFMLLTPLLAPHLGISLIDGYTPLFLFLVVPLLETPSFVYSYQQAAQGRAALGTWPLVLENAVRTPALVLVAFMYSWSTGGATLASAGTHLHLLGFSWTVQIIGPSFLTAVALAYVVGASVPFVALLLHSLVSERGLYRHMTLQGAVPELRSLGVFAAPLVGAMFLTYAVSTLPPFLVAGFLSAAALQAFSSANAFLLLLMFLPNAITLPLFPDMASLFVRGENRELRRRTRKSLRWTVMILAPAIVAMVTFRKVLLLLLYSGAITTGPLDAEYALALLVISVVPQSIFRVTGSVLDAVGQQKRELYLSAIQLVVLVSAMVGILWPTSPLHGWGITGAALAVLFSMSAGMFANLVYLDRYVQVKIPLRPYAQIIFAAGVTFLFFSNTFVATLGELVGVHGLAIPFSAGHYAVLALVIVIGFVAYVIVIARIGELTKQDVAELSGSLGLPRWIPYVVSRLCWRETWPDPPGDDAPFPEHIARRQKVSPP